jgi:hypothetical protein
VSTDFRNSPQLDISNSHPRGDCAGAALSDNDDEKLAATGHGMIALGLASAVGSARFARAGRGAGGSVVDALKRSPLGVKALNAISYDILAAPDASAAVRATRG